MDPQRLEGVTPEPNRQWRLHIGRMKLQRQPETLRQPMPQAPLRAARKPGLRGRRPRLFRGFVGSGVGIAARYLCRYD